MSTSKIAAIITVLGLVPFLGAAADLRIVGKSGITNELKNVEIVYTVKPTLGFYTEDRESGGIRIYQGDATVTVEWSRIRSVIVASGTNATVNLTGGGEKIVGLAKFGVAIVQGTTDLGSAKMSLSDITSIEVLQTK